MMNRVARISRAAKRSARADGSTAPASLATGATADPRSRDTNDALRILFIVHNCTCAGGNYYRGLGLAKPLARRGQDVSLMSIHPTHRWRTVEREIDGIKHIESPDLFWGAARSSWDPWEAIARTRWIRRREFDVIHTVDTRPAVSLPALLARKSSRAVWIADWTDWWGRGGVTTERERPIPRMLIGPVEQFFEERPRRYADGTVVISHALAHRVRGLGVRTEDILYLPPGTDPESIRTTTRAAARRRVGLPNGRYVGYLGHIYQRDADLLFDALARLDAADAKLLMVGEPRCHVDDRVKDRVTVTGRLPLDAMLDHLSACDVLLLPLSDNIANRGRWPSKVNEYVAVGRPIVACDVGDVAGLLRDNELGVMVRPESAEFAAGIDRLLRDPNRAREIGQRARTIARTVYSQDARAEELERFYRKIVSEKSPRVLRPTEARWQVQTNRLL
jgi:glycosyltransferase involved in cell wall biosynthesis